MKLRFNEIPAQTSLRVGVSFADWDRHAVNGNSVGMFFWVFTDSGKPNPQEIFLRNDGVCVGRISTLLDTPSVLASLCPGHETSALFGHICINRFLLRHEGSIAVLVTDESGIRHHLGSITFSGNVPQEGLQKLDVGLSPILITSLGRSGSTVLANSLGLHQAVGQFGGYPYEYRFFSYCLHATSILTAPANHDFSMGGDAFENRHLFNIGFNPFNHRDYDRLTGNDDLRQFYEGDFSRETARFFMAQAKQAIALSASGKPKATAFVEKMAGPQLANLAEHVCAGVKEIILIREFWDMALSMLAFDAKRGTTSFFSGDPDSWLISMAFQHAHLVRRSRIDGKMLVEYEDLMRDPKARLSRLVRELDIDWGAASIKSMMKPFGVTKYRGVHSTDPQKKDEFRTWFSPAAIKAAEHLLQQSKAVTPAAVNDLWATWRAERSDIHGLEGAAEAMRNVASDGRLLLPASWSEAFGAAVSQERESWLLRIRAMQEDSRKLQRDADRQVAAQAERATRAEAYSQALAVELERHRKAIEAGKKSERRLTSHAAKQVAAVTERATRAEEYSKSLAAELAKQKDAFELEINNRDRESQRLQERYAALLASADLAQKDAAKQIAALSSRASRAEAYSQSLLDEKARYLQTIEQANQSRERSLADAGRQAAALTARAEKGEKFAQALRDELDRTTSAYALERDALLAERARAGKELEATADRAKRAEQYNRALIAELEKLRAAIAEKKPI